MDPFTGHIKAWVGGLDYRFFQYDHVKQGSRQAGSTFKPFVYLTALDNGYSPCDRIRDQRVTINYVENGQPMEWKPDNVTREYTGINMTLRHAMARSVNSVTAQLTEKVGWENVAKYAHKVGITSPLLPVPSIGLGSAGDVSVYEMVNAYSTFLNNGFRSEPRLVTRIEDRNGNVIQQFDPVQKRAIPRRNGLADDLHAARRHGGARRHLPGPVGLRPLAQRQPDWRQNRHHLQLLRRLVHGHDQRPDDRRVGGRRRPQHPLRRARSRAKAAARPCPSSASFMEKVYKDKELSYTPRPLPAAHRQNHQEV